MNIKATKPDFYRIDNNCSQPVLPNKAIKLLFCNPQAPCLHVKRIVPRHINSASRFIASALFLVAYLFLLASCSFPDIGEIILPRIAGTDALSDSTESQQSSGVLQFTEKTPYDANTTVVVNTTADVYEDDDRTSLRLTQLLFDEPIQIIERTSLWAKLRIDGRTEGWVRTRGIDSDWTCVDGRRYTERIIITDREKQIYSHPRNGIVIRDVGMGTELFVVSKSDNVYQVALPGNLTGWISENGVFQLNANEKIKKTTAEIFTQSCVKFRGTSYLRGGISFQGIDGAGILYIAAKINGVTLPRDFEGQYAGGLTVYNTMDMLEPGDVLFFSPNDQSSEIVDLGIFISDGQFIHASQHTGKVQYEDVSDPYFQQRILGVKRYF